MELPCVLCLKFPMCNGKDISKLITDCVNLRGFLKSRRGMIKAVKIIEEDKGICKLQYNNSKPIIFINYTCLRRGEKEEK